MSKSFKNWGQIPTRYTCDGESARPALEISKVPPHTLSLAIIVDDLDVKDQSGSNFLHWIIWNIHPHTTEIGENKKIKEAIQGKTSFGIYHWGAPCPTKGKHRYRFRLFALAKKINLEPDSNAEDLEEEMAGHIIAEAELIGTYHRNGESLWK